MKSSLKRLFLLTFYCVIGLSNGCDGPLLFPENQGAFNTKKNLNVLVLEHPQSYLKGKNKEIYGFDADLAESFALSQGFKLKWQVYKNSQALLRDFKNGFGDIAIPVLPSENLGGQIRTPLFDESPLSLFCRSDLKFKRGENLRQELQQLKKFKVIFSNKFNSLSSQQKIFDLVPENQRLVLDQDDSKFAFDLIERSQADCTLVEEKEGLYWAETYLQVQLTRRLDSLVQTSWLVSNSDLNKKIKSWFLTVSRNGDFLKIKERYSLNWKKLDSHDVRLFFKKKKLILPEYLPLIKKAARQAGLPWHLVAAVAYQESGWDPWAESHTGVKGFMQLTLETAARFQLKDRLDPEQSLWAGAQYLKFLLNQFPKSLNSKDRLALALAAYNIGLGHLWDAQDLARQMGKNPYNWKDLSGILPLLADHKYYTKLRYKQARGHETVTYVERTKSYYNLLVLRN